jgi:hypothetical protein
VTEHVTEFDTVYAYVLVLFGQEQSQKPVGGFVEPVNKLAVLVPWLTIVGSVAAISVVIVKPWKKAEN